MKCSREECPIKVNQQNSVVPAGVRTNDGSQLTAGQYRIAGWIVLAAVTRPLTYRCFLAVLVSHKARQSGDAGSRKKEVVRSCHGTLFRV